MLIIPAIDLKNGKVVRLVRGEASQERIYGQDSVGIRFPYWVVAATTSLSLESAQLLRRFQRQRCGCRNHPVREAFPLSCLGWKTSLGDPVSPGKKSTLGAEDLKELSK